MAASVCVNKFSIQYSVAQGVWFLEGDPPPPLEGGCKIIGVFSDSKLYYLGTHSAR